MTALGLHSNPMYLVYNGLEAFAFLCVDFLLYCHSSAFDFKKAVLYIKENK